MASRMVFSREASPGVSRVLLVDDEAAIRRAVKSILLHMKCAVTEAEDGVEAIGKLQGATFDLVITDLRMPRADGFAVVRAVRERQPRAAVVVLTASGSTADCVTVMRAGATNFVTKPFHDLELEQVVKDALTEVQSAESDRGKTPRGTIGRPQSALIGESPRLKTVLAMVERVASSEATVLITGESGTGKEVVARLLHGLSARAGNPFIAVNCGAIPEGLVESELFGHARGSFTGATEKRMGKFAVAEGGTIFLDEIGELPLGAQVKLLRVLQEREVTPVGESKPQRIDARVVAATNRDLESHVKAGKFREDLFFRLNVVPIEMPALRDYKSDVRLLAHHFLEAANGRAGRNTRFGEATLDYMENYAWPGNVRELENLVERLVVVGDEEIMPDSLPTRMKQILRRSSAPSEPIEIEAPPPGMAFDLQRALGETEWKLIDEAMLKSGGNKTQAAALLGMKRTTLIEKLKRRR